MNRVLIWIRPAGAAVAVMALVSCAGGQEAAPRPELTAPTAESPATTSYGPTTPPVASTHADETSAATAAKSKKDQTKTAIAPPETTISTADSSGRRTDGRPSWWIDGTERQNGEVLIAAEALGSDIRMARRAAIDAGLGRLERELGHSPDDWVVKATIIKPLRAVRGPESVNRFVGYVLIAAAD